MEFKGWKNENPYLKLFIGSKEKYLHVSRGYDSFNKPISLDSFRFKDNTLQLVEEFMDPNNEEGICNSALSEYPYRNYRMVHDYFFDNMTMAAMAKKYELTHEGIRQILGKCARRARKYVYEHEIIEETEDPKQLPISALNLSVRSYNGLHRAGINTIDDVVVKTRKDLLHIRNLGAKCVDEIEDKLKEKGLYLMEE